MATHSSILAWRIPWKEEPGGLQSMGSHRVGHDSGTFTFWGRDTQRLPICCCSVAKSCLTLCDPMDCSTPSPSPGVCPSSCPLYQRCHPTVSSSAAVSFCPQSFPASGSFPMSHAVIISEFYVSSDKQMIPPLWQKVKRN